MRQGLNIGLCDCCNLYACIGYMFYVYLRIIWMYIKRTLIHGNKNLESWEMKNVFIELKNWIVGTTKRRPLKTVLVSLNLSQRFLQKEKGKIHYEIKGKKRKVKRCRDTKDRFKSHLSINNSKRWEQREWRKGNIWK